MERIKMWLEARKEYKEERREIRIIKMNTEYANSLLRSRLKGNAPPSIYLQDHFTYNTLAKANAVRFGEVDDMVDQKFQEIKKELNSI